MYYIYNIVLYNKLYIIYINDGHVKYSYFEYFLVHEFVIRQHTTLRRQNGCAKRRGKNQYWQNCQLVVYRNSWMSKWIWDCVKLSNL